MTGALGSLILSGLFIGAALVTREWILLFGVVLAAGFVFFYSQNAGRRYAVLSSTGRHVVRSFSGLRRPLSRETFTTAEIQRLGLHASETNDDGALLLESVLFVDLPGGLRVHLAYVRGVPFHGRQLMLAEAQQVADFLGLDLERTGIGAPPGIDGQRPE
ncbi:hypothetical protein HGQ17_08150 [Nesterenkonia sp. MY13]|uniref:Uncharacterized protein n=1 Tax=Nesterenkonia sedimenti TaxID=1463632 RepID=A0A7X8YDR5_9MICC|nr:hypothetical protein [Nesterenkonia sedimenti]NLS09968.1 hypothetical protein [Nesterenkonia sedimenti]